MQNTDKRDNEIEHLRNMTDEEAHANALSDPDAQPLASIQWGAQWKDAVRLHDLPGETILEKLQNFKQRRPKKSLTVRYDADIVEYYQGKGKGYQRAMNDALRVCMELEQGTVTP